MKKYEDAFWKNIKSWLVKAKHKQRATSFRDTVGLKVMTLKDILVILINNKFWIYIYD